MQTMQVIIRVGVVGTTFTEYKDSTEENKVENHYVTIISSAEGCGGVLWVQGECMLLSEHFHWDGNGSLGLREIPVSLWLDVEAQFNAEESNHQSHIFQAAISSIDWVDDGTDQYSK
jgi:hypothetical protein